MKTCLIKNFLTLVLAISTQIAQAQNSIDYVRALKDTLEKIKLRTDEDFLKIHCTSIEKVISSKLKLSYSDTNLIRSIYFAFEQQSSGDNLKTFDVYYKRGRSLIVAWESPTDKRTSFTWLILPKDWDSSKEYPLYIQLHGLWEVAADPIKYLNYPFMNKDAPSFAFEDGYVISPWGRGNLWYEGISETDIFECISHIESLVKVDQNRKYLSGHSMGGYGAWRLGYLSADTWAAIGIHAGAINYGNGAYYSETVFNTLKNLPVYFVCGDKDRLLGINMGAYNWLRRLRCAHTYFSVFSGGHEYLQSNVENMYSWMRQFKKEGPLNSEMETFSKSETNIKCYPNPFIDKVNIEYYLPVATNVIVEIYNIQGKKIKTLLSATQKAGVHIASWSPENRLPGLYNCVIRTNYSTLNCKIFNMKK